MSTKPTPGVRGLLTSVAECYSALRIDGFTHDETRVIIMEELIRRLPPVRPYAPEPEPRTDLEPPE